MSLSHLLSVGLRYSMFRNIYVGSNKHLSRLIQKKKLPQFLKATHFQIYKSSIEVSSWVTPSSVQSRPFLALPDCLSDNNEITSTGPYSVSKSCPLCLKIFGFVVGGNFCVCSLKMSNYEGRRISPQKKDRKTNYFGQIFFVST